MVIDRGMGKLLQFLCFALSFLAAVHRRGPKLVCATASINAAQSRVIVRRTTPARCERTVSFTLAPRGPFSTHSTLQRLSVGAPWLNQTQILFERPSSWPSSRRRSPLTRPTPSGSSSSAAMGRTSFCSSALLLVYVGKKPLFSTT